MILNNPRDLLAYYGARSFRALEAQFNSDGRYAQLLLTARSRRGQADLAIMSGPGDTAARVHVMKFPLHISDLLGQIELERIAATHMLLT